jgi:hypothetical protein
MSGKCKGGVHGMFTMDLIILDEIAPTWKDVKPQGFRQDTRILEGEF